MGKDTERRMRRSNIFLLIGIPEENRREAILKEIIADRKNKNSFHYRELSTLRTLHILITTIL